VDWCDLRLVERSENLGLGKSILAGVTEVLSQYEAVIVFEDDLICVPGTYEYLAAALQHYKDDSRVMSVTGWTHPRVTPSGIEELPYFDGRAECLAWGTWRRAWHGMDRSAMSLVRACRIRGIDVHRYGSDLLDMARSEIRQNIWAVRWLYLHILKRGLCLRPPWSMVEHIGNDERATNAAQWNEGPWASPPLQSCPKTPLSWPEPRENKECPRLWRNACGRKPRPWAVIRTRVGATAARFSQLLAAFHRSPGSAP
jgi:hypothetical protein